MTDQQQQNLLKILAAAIPSLYHGDTDNLHVVQFSKGDPRQVYTYGSTARLRETLESISMRNPSGRVVCIIDGEPLNGVDEIRLADRGFRFYRLQGGVVKQATYKTHADGRRGARGWAKTDFTPDQVRDNPYALWL